MFVHYCFLSEGVVFGEHFYSPVWPLVVVVSDASLIILAGICYMFYFPLVVCILNVYLDIMLLQRLGVIDICFVLIYFLYQKI